MARTLMRVAGVVFIILGVLGFINDPILGIFEVDMVHNLVHLASGILALVFASQGEDQARRFSLILGVVYGLVAVLGFLMGGDMLLGLMEINGADNFLHLLLAIVFIVVGLKKPASTGSSM